MFSEFFFVFMFVYKKALIAKFIALILTIND